MPKKKQQTPLTFGQQLADKTAALLGSWRFIIAQSLVLTIYILWNTLSGHRFDPYPFILLNLALSFQAAYSAPVIMMSQNRQDQIDRKRSVDMFELETKDHNRLLRLEKHIDQHFDKLVDIILKRFEDRLSDIEQKLSD